MLNEKINANINTQVIVIVIEVPGTIPKIKKSNIFLHPIKLIAIIFLTSKYVNNIVYANACVESNYSKLP